MSTCTPHPPLPLTDPFTVPSSCTATLILTTYTATTTILTSPPPGTRFSASFSFTSTYLTSDLSAYGLVAGYATSPPGGGPRFHDAGCYPARYGELRGAWFLQDDDRVHNSSSSTACSLLPTYYSPGACPVSWGSSTSILAPLPAGTGEVVEETAGTCCPPAFTIQAGGVPVYCESVIAAPTDVYAPDAGSWTTVETGTVRAAAVEVRWREGDLPLLGGGGGEGERGGLSGGAKAGIGAGLAVAGLGLAAIGVGLYLRRRRRARKGKGKGKEGDFAAEEDKGWARSPDGDPRELDGERCAQELPVEERRVEMDGGERLVAEMDARGGELRRAGPVRHDGKSCAGDVTEGAEWEEDTTTHGAVAELE